MQKVFAKDGRFIVPTKHDKRRLDMLIVSGHRVLVTPTEVIFHDIRNDESVEVVYPAGTGFMFNGEQKIYQIFPGGMYHMLRSKTHASHGERRDSREMLEMQQLTFDFVSQLRTWNQIGDEGQDFTNESLLSLAISLDHPKRDEHKLKAASHYHKASQLRNGNGKRLPMPAAFTASAGAAELDHRREDVRVILGWIDPERLRVFGVVQGVHERIDDAWRFFSPQSVDQPAHPVKIAASRPMEQTAKVLRDRVRPIVRGLREIRVRPLNALAHETVEAITKLGRKIVSAKEKADIGPELLAVREPLATMRAIRALEMDAIMPLSMVLHRWGQLDLARRELARQRVRQACQSTIATFQFEAANLPPQLVDRSMEALIQISETAAEQAEDSRKTLVTVKRGLKRLSATLAAT